MDSQMTEIIALAFESTKKFIWKGAFSFLFYFCAIFTLKDGILPIMANTFPGQGNSYDQPDPNQTKDDQMDQTDIDTQ